MMSTNVHLDATKRHDAVLLFDVTDGNPNGDPDAGNLPRVDPETMEGLVTDVAIKRKVRNYVNAIPHDNDADHFKIYVRDHEPLNDTHMRAYKALDIKWSGSSKQPRPDVARAQEWMCANFYDVRTFGAVMSTDVNAGQVKGPMQLTFARSLNPIVSQDFSITRMAVTERKDFDLVEGEDGKNTGGKRNTMARKATVPYGLYKGAIFFSPQQAKDTGFDDDDLGLFWDALERMWDFDRSASRGMMACRGVVIFSHDSPYGNAPAHKLLERVHVTRHDGVVAPRSFADYTVSVDEAGLPEGVTVTHLGT